MTRRHATDNAVLLADLVRLGVAIADRAVVADIEALPPEPTASGAIINDTTIAWRDTRAMLSPHEHAPQVIDMVRLALAYGTARRLLAWHPTQPHLVRIARGQAARWGDA